MPRFQKCHLEMDKRSKGKKILFVCERNSAQSPFVSRNILCHKQIHYKKIIAESLTPSPIQDGGAVQPLSGETKEHDGKKC